MPSLSLSSSPPSPRFPDVLPPHSPSPVTPNYPLAPQKDPWGSRDRPEPPQGTLYRDATPESTSAPTWRAIATSADLAVALGSLLSRGSTEASLRRALLRRLPRIESLLGSAGIRSSDSAPAAPGMARSGSSPDQLAGAGRAAEGEARGGTSSARGRGAAGGRPGEGADVGKDGIAAGAGEDAGPLVCRALAGGAGVEAGGDEEGARGVLVASLRSAGKMMENLAVQVWRAGGDLGAPLSDYQRKLRQIVDVPGLCGALVRLDAALWVASGARCGHALLFALFLPSFGLLRWDAISITPFLSLPCGSSLLSHLPLASLGLSSPPRRPQSP